MGTRFYASQEAEGQTEAKRRIVEAEGGQTVRSIVFDLSRRIRWPAPYTGRLLRNRLPKGQEHVRYDTHGDCGRKLRVYPRHSASRRDRRTYLCRG